jgi:hypothetical protein
MTAVNEFVLGVEVRVDLYIMSKTKHLNHLSHCLPLDRKLTIRRQFQSASTDSCQCYVDNYTAQHQFGLSSRRNWQDDHPFKTNNVYILQDPKGTKRSLRAITEITWSLDLRIIDEAFAQQQQRYLWFATTYQPYRYENTIRKTDHLTKKHYTDTKSPIIRFPLHLGKGCHTLQFSTTQELCSLLSSELANIQSIDTLSHHQHRQTSRRLYII